MNRNTGIILALDVTDRVQALEIARSTSPFLDAIKVNYPLALSCGMGIVTELSHGSCVLCDFKVADIPHTNTLIVKEAVRRGARGIICHAFPGADSVRACVDAAGDAEVFVVTEMSHPGGEEFTAALAERFARLAVDAGAQGIIAPATRPARLRRIREIVGDLEILSPGVGAQGGSAVEALMAGADHVIVGRSIYQAPDPADAAQHLATAIAKLR